MIQDEQVQNRQSEKNNERMHLKTQKNKSKAQTFIRFDLKITIKYHAKKNNKYAVV